jgi:hypothetical protein
MALFFSTSPNCLSLIRQYRFLLLRRLRADRLSSAVAHDGEFVQPGLPNQGIDRLERYVPQPLYHGVIFRSLADWRCQRTIAYELQRFSGSLRSRHPLRSVSSPFSAESIRLAFR